MRAPLASLHIARQMATNPYVAYAEQAAAFLFIDGGKDLQNALTFFQVLLGVSRQSSSHVDSYAADEL